MRNFTFGALFLSSFLFLFQPAAAQPPAGYYETASGLSGAALKTALHNIIKGHNQVSYDAIWGKFLFTDTDTDNTILDIYSDGNSTGNFFTYSEDQCGSYQGEADCYNREHTWPRSWVGGDVAPMFTDLFNVYPTDGYVNGMRSNYPYGEVGSPTYTSLNGSMRGPNAIAGYSGTVFEPIDAYKGDLARSYLYMVTRYENLVAGWPSNSSEVAAILDGTTFPAFEEWYIELLLQWHNDDPVSLKEQNRNEAIYGIQGNRNPFIDHPEYVNLIWGSGLAEEPQYHVTDFSAQTITLQWEDATGTYLPDAYLVRMSAESFEAIEAPLDGTPVSTDAWNQNIAYGKQKAVFGGLTPGQVYYFKIYSYKGSGSTIDYKTDGTVPQTSIQAN